MSWRSVFNGAVGRAVLTIGIAVAVSAILFVALGPNTRGPGSSSDKKLDVGRAAVRVDVQPDASLRVEEQLHFRYSGHDFTADYRDIALTDETQLTSVSLTDGPLGRYHAGGATELGSSDLPGSFGTAPIRGGERIVWHFDDQHGGARDFSLRYRAIFATEAYRDVVLVHWAVWGDQWQFALEKLRAQLVMPGAASGDGTPLRVWATPGKLDTEPTIGDGTATFAAERVPSGTQTTLWAMYPRSAFTSVKYANVHDYDGRAQLDQQADAAAPSALDRLDNALWIRAVPVAVVLLLFVAALLAALVFAARERPTDVPEHLPGPPTDANPAVGYGLAHEGLYDQRVVLATLLDLADRGYYTQGSGEGDDHLDLVLGKAPAAERPTSPALTTGEQAVLDFFDRLIGEQPGGLSTLKDRIPKHDATWSGRWTAMNSDLATEAKAPIRTDLDLRLHRIALGGVALVLFALLLAATYARAADPYVAIIGFVLTAGVIAAPRSVSLMRLTPKVREESARWQAFERWTRDFPRLSDDPPATLLLWKRILVFGVAFGTAKRVIDSGRIPEAIASSPEFFAGSPGYLFTGSDFGSSFSSGFSSQVAQQSSSGAGGGGGGGGGSSGGGGGGGW